MMFLFSACIQDRSLKNNHDSTMKKLHTIHYNYKHQDHLTIIHYFIRMDADGHKKEPRTMDFSNLIFMKSFWG